MAAFVLVGLASCGKELLRDEYTGRPPDTVTRRVQRSIALANETGPTVIKTNGTMDVAVRYGTWRPH